MATKEKTLDFAESFYRRLADAHLSVKRINDQQTGQADDRGKRMLPGDHVVVNSAVFGAQVAWHEDRPRYTYTIGMALALFDAANELACTPTFMPDIGSPLEIDEHSNPIVPRIRFHDYSNNDDRRGWPFRKRPLDEKRQLLAFDLYERAIHLIALHEQGHYISGHLGLIKSANGASPWVEVGENHGLSVDQRLLEMQADTFAAQISSNMDALHLPGEGAVSHNPELAAYFLRCTTVSIALVGALLEINDRQISPSHSPPTHPSAGARLLNMLRHVLVARSTVFKRRGKLVEVELTPEMVEEPPAVLKILGARPLSAGDVEVFFSEDALTSESPAIAEVISLMKAIPASREVLTEHAVAALHTMSFGSADEQPISAMQWDDGIKAPERYLKHFGHMTPGDLQRQLLEAVVRSGNHIPWSGLNDSSFTYDCIVRGRKYLTEKYPGVFFPE